MNVNGTEAGYPVAGYETRKTERNAAGRNFADAINKAATKKETNAFRPESSDEVMQAWDKARAGLKPLKCGSSEKDLPPSLQVPYPMPASLHRL